MAKKEAKKKDIKKTAKTTKATKNEKNKKTFFKSFKTELKKVVWPTPKQLANNTVTVITIVLLCALIVFVLDFAFETINKQGIYRLRDAVLPQRTTAQQEENATTNTEGTESTEGTETTLKVNEDGSTEILDGDQSQENTENGGEGTETTESAQPQTETTETQNPEQ